MSGICFYRLPPHHANPSGWIAYVANIYTLPDYRRQGLATRLSDLALEEAKRRGCRVARLHASAEGRSIYENKGFAAAEGYMSMRL